MLLNDDFKKLCHFVHSKNEVNRKRRNCYARATRQADNWAQAEHEKVFMCIFRKDTRDVRLYTKPRYIWFKDEAKQKYAEANSEYEAYKLLGKKWMPPIKKICKEIGAKLLWDSSGYVKWIKYNDTWYDRWNVARIAENYVSTKALEEALVG